MRTPLKSFRTRFVLPALLGILGLPIVGQAQTINWNNANGGNFATGSNWLGGIAPGANNTANFDTGGNVGVTFTGPAVTGGLTLGDGSYTFNLDGHTYSLSGSSDAFRMGLNSGESGRLSLVNGTLLTDSAIIGNAAVTNHGLFLNDASHFVATGTVRLGVNGTGGLVVRNGATLIADGLVTGGNAGSEGSLIVQGTATIKLGTFGSSGTSDVFVIDGGQLNTGSVFMAGSGSTSSVGIGPNSQWNVQNGSIATGSGAATIDVQGGA